MRFRLVVGVMDDGARRMRSSPPEMRPVAGRGVFGAGRRPFARIAGACAGQSDDAGEDGAEQRQKDDR
jgi:hypothetical protein